METMIEILNDVARSRAELADLALTENVDPARLEFCDACITALECEIEGIVLKPWKPWIFGNALAAIVATMQRIEQVEKLIIDGGPTVLERGQGDELIRLNVALLTLHTLRFRLRTLFDDAVNLYQRIPMAELN